MSVLYIEPQAGLAGDMLLSALCGLCDGYKEIEILPEKLHLHDGKVEINTLDKNGIVCQHVRIIDLNEATSHNHSHGHTHNHDHSHDQTHNHGHSDGHKHDHHHRHLSDIIQIIEKGHISEGAKAIAKEIFRIIGESESKIHNIPLEKIHFHEVSAVDSILDIVGCAVMLDKLNVTKTYSDPVCVGHGTVNTQHGVLPVPAPATQDILHGIPTYKGDEAGEKTTPTGAAILKYLNPDFSGKTAVTEKSAYGPGQKDFKLANVVRVSTLKEVAKPDAEMYVIETQLDDISGEMIGADFQNRLLSLGASDFFYTPIHMKKGRSGLKITVTASERYLEKACEFILENTTTIGLRYYKVGKKMMTRSAEEIETEYGLIKVKVSTKPSGRQQKKIEYESILEISNQLNKSIIETQELLQPFLNK